MTGAKRTPYREPTRGDAPGRLRGAVIRRPSDPEDARDIVTAARTPPTDPDAGVFSGLVAPHPGSTGGERLAQIALTLLGLPVIVPTFVLVGWVDTRSAYNQAISRSHVATRPLGIAHPAAWMAGALALAVGCFAIELPFAAAAAVITTPLAALSARRALRARIVERELILALRHRR